jgi:hypothetical protein
MFKGSVDFGGGALTAGVNPLSGPSNDLFLVKFSPTGGHLWSKGIGDTQGQQQVAYDVAADGADNVVLTGTVGGNVNFGGGSTLPIGGQDIFIAKYTPAGGYLWAKRMGASGASDEYASAVTVDSSGSVIVTGYTNGPVDFGGGPVISNDPVSTNNVFIAKYAPSGDPVWSRSYGDSCDQKGRSVATDSSGGVLAAGEFYGTIDFGGGTISSPECLTTDGFLVRFSQ